MYLNKITLALIVIYAIINSIVVIDLSQRLEVSEEILVTTRTQTNAATMLLLAHVDLHELTETKKDVERYNDLLPLLPKKKYD